MATVRLFASVAEAAGTRTVPIEATTVADALAVLSERFGERFSSQLQHCRLYVNGETAEPSDVLGAGDELAVLPPVSGGAR